MKKGGSMQLKYLKQFIQSTYNKPAPETINGYQLDKSLSTETETVYYNEGTRKGVVSIRPTNSLKDVLSDIKAGLNLNYKNDQRFKQGYSTLNKVNRKYGLSNFKGIGYSLGAIVLEKYPKADELEEVFLFSKPVLPVDIVKGVKPLKNAVEVRSKWDPTSILKPLQAKAEKEIVVEPTSLNPVKEHQISHFLDKVDPEMSVGYGQLKPFEKMKVKELKELIKMRRRGQAKKYQVTNKRKKELVAMVEVLYNDYMSGGGVQIKNKMSKDEIMQIAKKVAKIFLATATTVVLKKGAKVLLPQIIAYVGANYGVSPELASEIGGVVLFIIRETFKHNQNEL